MLFEQICSIVQSKVQSIDGTKDGTFVMTRVAIAPPGQIFNSNTASNMAIAVSTAVFLFVF